LLLQRAAAEFPLRMTGSTLADFLRDKLADNSNGLKTVFLLNKKVKNDSKTSFTFLLIYINVAL
jgi:hypothetical protein